MGRSNRVSVRDLRRAYRLTHDCRDAGHDPAAWGAVMAEGLNRLVGGQVANVGGVRFDATGQVPSPYFAAVAGWGLADAARHAEVYQNPQARFEGFEAYFKSLVGGPRLITKVRADFIADRDWYRSDEYNRCFRPLRLNDFLPSFVREADPPLLRGFSVLRPAGGRGFGARERRLVGLFHAEIARHYGVALATDPAGPVGRLSPRLREVVDLLLDGDGEKQVAARLGVSRHTVHDYIREVYRRLGVSSRGELFALYRRRGR